MQTRTDHVQDMLGFMSIGVVIVKIITFFYKMLQFCLPTVGSRPIQLADCAAAAKACAINSVTVNSTGRTWDHRQAGCIQGRCVSAV